MDRLVACALACALVGRAAYAADTEPPQIGHELLKQADARQRIRIACTIYDESAIFEPRLYYRHAGEKTYLVMSLASSGDIYVATIPEDFVVRNIEYYLEAFDEHGNGPSRHATPDRPHLITVPVNTAPPPLVRADFADAPPEIDARDANAPPERPFWLAGGLGAGGMFSAGVAVFQFVKMGRASTNRDAALTDPARKLFDDEASAAQLFGIITSVVAAGLLGAAGYVMFAPPPATGAIAVP